ncbi:uncharacterized protein [Cicer arietinum]|uniref:Uncharacterized protein LOC101514112 n=1 Tax=Cicer arietinum TaxID=3827 RepID=A0A1S3E0H8_CICAR|nr:uncharacterized protein LOC101514112 [Cicer arietinum]XP_027188622.1 uncharacterized protein LOC101514112 [Cicer arietinum]XP_027188623.1 uncharacterized protein LOC101514112 [Cicer arietinum]
MAGTGNDPQKQLISIIRNFATERSQGERRVVALRKQIETLISELSEVNAELEKSKRCKELVEQELKGFELHLFLSEASVQTLEARVSLTQVDMSVVESYLETLKDEGVISREQFIHQMLDLNAKIRKFQESIVTCDTDAVEYAACRDPAEVIMKENDADVALGALESSLLEITSQTTKEEAEFQGQQKIYENVQRELIDRERKLSLMNMIVKETKELQDLTLQSSKLEATHSSLGEELQNRSKCPRCHLDNLESLSAVLQANEED